MRKENRSKMATETSQRFWLVTLEGWLGARTVVSLGGHVKRNCPQLDSEERKPKQFSWRKDGRHKASNASRIDHGSNSESELLAVSHAYALQATSSTTNWIVDSGATCHMCSSKEASQSCIPLVSRSKYLWHQLNVVGQGYVMEASPAARHSTTPRNFPDYYGLSVNPVKVEPSTVEEAMSTPEKDQWLGAMQEMDSLEENDVWELTELPEGRRPVGSKWVFKTKTNADGKIERY